MQIPAPTSAVVKAAEAEVNVNEPLVVEPSVPVRDAVVEVVVPPFRLLPVARTYHAVGCCNDPAAGPMNPVTPFGVAYPFVGPGG
jgi:hypothetical protein